MDMVVLVDRLIIKKNQKAMTKSLIKRPAFPSVWNTRDEFIAPFSSMFDRIIEQHFPEFKEDFSLSFSKGSYPKVDVVDYNDRIEIIAEIAGWKKDEISVEVDNGVLTISGDSSREEANDTGMYLVKELKRSSFQRSFKLTDRLDDSSVSAKFENGILHLSVKKKVEISENPKKLIEIQ